MTGGAGFIIVETGPHTYIADSAAAGAKENMVRGGGPEDTLKKRRNAKAARRIHKEETVREGGPEDTKEETGREGGSENTKEETGREGGPENT